MGETELENVRTDVRSLRKELGLEIPIITNIECHTIIDESDTKLKDENETIKQESNTNIHKPKPLYSVNFEEEEINILASIKHDKNGQNSPKMGQFSRNSVSTINAYFTSSLPSAIEKIEKITKAKRENC